MKIRKLGGCGLAVAEMGLGRGSATTDFGERDEQAEIDTARRAIDLGVTLLDSSDAYGKGKHERIIAAAIKGRRDQVVVCSKFGNIDVPGGGKAYNGTPDYVRAACDASLARLGVDVIDLYYLHRIDPDVPIEDTVGAMAGLVKAGKVRYLGLCEAGAQTLERACAVHPISALQTEYSLWSREVEADILPACRRLGIGFVPYSPLGRGLLTGRIRKPEDIAPHDRRRIHPRFHAGNLERNLELLAPLERVAQAHAATAAQIALAWLLGRGDDIVPIPGTKQIRYLEQNVAAAAIDLAAAERQLLDDAFRPGAGAGERYPRGYFKTLGA
jgi:aryl-alcohol dehydrogenase-like predicted oxidoreductase